MAEQGGEQDSRHEGSVVSFTGPILDESDFGPRGREVIEQVIESEAPAFITLDGRIAATIIPMSFEEVARQLMDTPAVQDAFLEANEALADGRVRPASEVVAEADAQANQG